ncbi:MAG TPA: hypothetical protein DCO75_12510 [Fibrobacteres bacterium]|jgi:hypothetical protein|nr:hypothetical protein [Fibrobacterota bacterium]
MFKYKSFIGKIVKHADFLMLLTIIPVIISSLTCVRRDNPWDPINYIQTDACLPDSALTINFKTNALNLVSSAESLSTAAKRFNDTLSIDSILNKTIIDSNKNIASKNITMLKTNAVVDSLNRVQSIVDSLKLKSELSILLTNALSVSYIYDSAYYQINETLQKLYGTFIYSCPDNVSLIASFMDSVNDSLEAVDSIILLIKNRKNALSALIADSNAAYSIYNYRISLMNDTIKAYNDSINYLKQIQRYTQINTASDLQSSIGLAKAGDTLVLLQKNFVITTGGLSGFTNSGTSDSPIVIMGNPLDTTIISTVDGVVLSRNNYFVFRNITFTGSNNSGFKVSGSEGVKLDNCSFINNKLNGAEILDSKNIRMTDCKFLNNEKDGVRVSNSTDLNNQLWLTNVLVAKNKAYGLEIINTIIYGKNMTISNNGSSGVYIYTPSQYITIMQSLVTFNNGFGIYIPPQGEPLSIDNTSDIFGNTLGSISNDTIVSYSLRSVNPPYTDTLNNDFSIATGGLIDSLQQPPWEIIIGYRY